MKREMPIIPSVVKANEQSIAAWRAEVLRCTTPTVDEEGLRKLIVTADRYRYQIGEFFKKVEKEREVNSLLFMQEVISVRNAVFDALLKGSLEIVYTGYTSEWADSVTRALWERCPEKEDILRFSSIELHLCMCEELIMHDVKSIRPSS